MNLRGLAPGRRFGRGLLWVAVTLVLSAPARAQAPEPEPGFARERMYLGFSMLPNFTLDGVTFDGQTVYVEENGTETFLLPTLDERTMPRIVAGFRTRPFALEISYERTTHDGTFLDEFVGEAAFNVVNVDFKFFANTRSRVQPHFVAGLAFPWLKIYDGSFDGDLVGDGSFRGQGLNLEGGVTLLATPRIGVSAGFAYRVLWFNRATGVTDTIYRLRPRFRETSSGIIVMGFVTL
jgi:hypothetical protein